MKSGLAHGVQFVFAENLQPTDGIEAFGESPVKAIPAKSMGSWTGTMKIDESYIVRRRFLCGMLGGRAAALGVGVGLPIIPYAGNLREQPPPPFFVEDAFRKR
jgi:hypothetical protein